MFYFELILDSQENCKDGRQSSHIPIIQFPLFLTSYITM